MSFQRIFFTNNKLIKMDLPGTGFEDVGQIELPRDGIRSFGLHDNRGYFDCQVIINNSRKSLYIEMDCETHFNIILPHPSWYYRRPLSNKLQNKNTYKPSVYMSNQGPMEVIWNPRLSQTWGPPPILLRESYIYIINTSKITLKKLRGF
jgi:hypothetical protein